MFYRLYLGVALGNQVGAANSDLARCDRIVLFLLTIATAAIPAEIGEVALKSLSIFEAFCVFAVLLLGLLFGSLFLFLRNHLLDLSTLRRLVLLANVLAENLAAKTVGAGVLNLFGEGRELGKQSSGHW